MNNGNSNNLNTRISKDDIFQYINSLNERIDYLEAELAKAEAYKDAESTLIKMLRTSQKAVEAAEEQIAAAKRRNDAAVKFLEDHMAQNNKPAETAAASATPAEEPAQEPEQEPEQETATEEPQVVESDLTPEPDEKPALPTDEDIDSINDALGLGDIFKIFKN